LSKSGLSSKNIAFLVDQLDDDFEDGAGLGVRFMGQKY